MHKKHSIHSYFCNLKFLGLAILLFLSNLCFSQTKLNDLFPNFDFLKSKKNQIENLNFKIDSLVEVLQREREFNTKKNQIIKINIDKLAAEIITTQQTLVLCLSNLDSVNKKNQILSDTESSSLNHKNRHNIEAKHTPIPMETWIDLPVFRENWSSTNLFPYVYSENNKIPDSLRINLFDKDTGFCIPYKGYVSSGFGMRGGRMHKGLDVRLNRHDTIRACMSGIIRFADYNNGGFGKLIIIRHLNGLETYYAHLHNMVVKPNDFVKAGDFIGTGGNTGTKRTGPHLHFECRWKDYPLDPKIFIDYDNFTLKSDNLIISPEVLRTKPFR